MKTTKALRSPAYRVAVNVAAAAVAGCFAGGSLAQSVLPSGGEVVSGTATFAQTGNNLTVTNSANAIINWQSFSIGGQNSVRFEQPSASSAVLNRVLANDPSVILGTLSSNGRVYLVNPAGILVGEGARIDVAGFAASTLNIRDEDFLAGKLLFAGGANAGGVQNFGLIRTPTGGSVYLVAPQVENHGVIEAPNGEVILAAGHSLQLADTATPGVTFEVSGDGQAVNLGNVLAESGRIGMVGAVVQQKGTLSADSVVNEGGRIFLRASKQVEVDAAGRIVANGTKGGEVSVQSADMALISGEISASGSTGEGGKIDVLGDKVGLLAGARLDASGQTGGGSVRVGGDLQGKNAAVQNATVTYVDADAQIKADAVVAGEGGKIIVWADDTTRFYGRNSARGGEHSGNGGFVEVSGKRYLDYQGVTDTRAVSGTSGMLLLDPSDITVTLAAYAGTTMIYGGGGFFTPSTVSNTITWETITTQLAQSNVTVSTSSAYGALGDITIAYGNSFAYGFSLNLLANHDIIVAPADAPIINSSFGGISLVAGWDGTSTTTPTVTAGNGSILFNSPNANITTTGGALKLVAGTEIKRVDGGNLSSGGGAISLQTYGGAIDFDTISSGGGTVTVEAYGGGVNFGSVFTGHGAATINAYGSIVGTSIDTSSTGNFFYGGWVDVHATTSGGNVQVGQISANGAAGGAYGQGSNGGLVNVSADDGDVTIDQILSQGGDSGIIFTSGYGGGNGGSVWVRMNPNGLAQTGPHQVTVGRISTTGGSAADVGSVVYGGSGGNGGTVFVFSQVAAAGSNIRVGSVSSVGGDGGNGTSTGGSGGSGGAGGDVNIIADNGSVFVDPSLIPGSSGLLESKGGRGGNVGDVATNSGNGGGAFGVQVHAYGGDIVLGESAGYGSTAVSASGQRGTGGFLDGSARSIVMAATGDIQLSGENGQVVFSNADAGVFPSNSVTLIAGWDGGPLGFPNVGPFTRKDTGSILFNNADANILGGGGDVLLYAGGKIAQATAGVGGKIDTRAFDGYQRLSGGFFSAHAENGDILLGDIVTSGRDAGSVVDGPAPTGGTAGGVSIEIGTNGAAKDTVQRSITVGSITANGGLGGTSNDTFDSSGGSGGSGGSITLSTEFANYGGSITVGNIVSRGGNGGMGSLGGSFTDGGDGGVGGSVSLVTGLYGGDIVFSNAAPVFESRGGNGGLPFGTGLGGLGGGSGFVTLDAAGGGFDLQTKTVLIQSLDGFNSDGNPAGNAGGVFLGAKTAITQGAGQIQIGYGGRLELNSQSNVVLNNSGNVLHGVAGVVGGNLTLVTQGGLDIGSSRLAFFPCDCSPPPLVPVVSSLIVGGSATLEAAGTDADLSVSGPLQYAANGAGSLQLISGRSIRVLDNITSGYGGSLSLLSNQAGLGGAVTVGFAGNAAPTFGDRANADQQVFLKSYGGDIVVQSADGSPSQGLAYGGYGGAGVSIYGNAVLLSEGGNITIKGRGASSGLDGVFDSSGIDIGKPSLSYGATIDSGGGNLTLLGYGGTDSYGGNIGVLLRDRTTLATSSGSISMVGYGGSAAGVGNAGVVALGAVNTGGGVVISTSGTGGISIAGYGGSGIEDGDGVYFEDTSISAGGVIGTGGPVSIYGSAGPNAVGVALWFSEDGVGTPVPGSGTHVTAYGSGVTVTGLGNGGVGEGQASGIIVAHQSSIDAYGNVSLTGTATSGTGGLEVYGGDVGGIGIGNHGVVIGDWAPRVNGTLTYAATQRSGGTVQSHYGGVSIVGTSNATAGDFNSGVTITQGATVIGATGVSISGYGGTGGGNVSNGVTVADGATIAVDAGALSIVGQARASGNGFGNVGVEIADATISGTSVAINGVGNGLNDGDGVRLSNSNVSLNGPGRILIEGTGSSVAGATAGFGVALGGNLTGRAATPLIDAGSAGRVDIVGLSQSGGAIVFDPVGPNSPATIYGGSVHLKSLGGAIALDWTTIQANLLAFSLAGNLTQTPNTSLGGGQLVVTGAGSADLQYGSNAFTGVAANLPSDSFKLTNVGSLSIDSLASNVDYGGLPIGGVTGVTADGIQLRVSSYGGAITQSFTSTPATPGLKAGYGGVTLVASNIGYGGATVWTDSSTRFFDWSTNGGVADLGFYGDINTTIFDNPDAVGGGGGYGGDIPGLIKMQVVGNLTVAPDLVEPTYGGAIDVSGDTLDLSATGNILFTEYGSYGGGFVNSLGISLSAGQSIVMYGGASGLSTVSSYTNYGGTTFSGTGDINLVAGTAGSGSIGSLGSGIGVPGAIKLSPAAAGKVTARAYGGGINLEQVAGDVFSSAYDLLVDPSHNAHIAARTGNLFVNDATAAGVDTGLYLSAYGSVTQLAGGSVSGGGKLFAKANGNVDFAYGGNGVSSFSAVAGSGNISLNNTYGGLALGTAGVDGSAGVIAYGGAGSIAISNNGTINLADYVKGSSVSLSSGGGAIDGQPGFGGIYAGTLALYGGGIFLRGDNRVGAVSATSGADFTMSVAYAGPTTLGAITVNTAGNATFGVDFSAEDSIIVGGPINAAGKSINLSSQSGVISGSGALNAASLAASALGSVVLSGGQVGSFGASSQTGSVNFTNNGAFAIDGVGAYGGIGLSALSGAITQSGAYGLSTQTGNIALAAYGLGTSLALLDLDGGAGGTYALTSYGDMHVRFADSVSSSQLDVQGGGLPRLVELATLGTLTLDGGYGSAGAAIDVEGDSLLLSANGDVLFGAAGGGFTNASEISLTSASGKVLMGSTSALATTLAYGSGDVFLAAGDTLGIGSVAAAGTFSAAATNSIALNGAISSAAAVDLTSSNGSVTQTGGSLSASAVTASAAGTINLSGASNSFSTLSAVAGSGIAVNDSATGLVISNLQITSAGNIAVANSGSMILDGAVATPSGSVSLTSGGALVQNSGAVAATALAVNAAGTVTLNSGTNAFGSLTGSAGTGISVINHQAQPGAFTVGSLSSTTGNITLVNYGAVAIPGPITASAGAVSITANSPLSVSGLISATGGISLTAANPGDITLSGTLATSAGNVDLAAPGGGITMTATGLIDAPSGNVTMLALNDIIMGNVNALAVFPTSLSGQIISLPATAPPTEVAQATIVQAIEQALTPPENLLAPDDAALYQQLLQTAATGSGSGTTNSTIGGSEGTFGGSEGSSTNGGESTDDGKKGKQDDKDKEKPGRCIG